jgi:hypothetical protein
MTLLKRAEIDLREKIGKEIEKFIESKIHPELGATVDQDYIDGLRRAIGVVREPLFHNAICPCSLCVKWEIKSCSDECNNHRQITEEEAKRFAEIQYIKETDSFACGWCMYGRNEWKITELLFDAENEFAITPCCHTEATEALDIPEPENDDQRKDDEMSYRYSVTGRL